MNSQELLKNIGFNNFIALDLETTGLNISNDQIIEISAIHFKDGEIFDEFTTLLKPSVSIPKKITELTGIKDKDIQNNSKDILRVTYEVIQYIEENNKEGPIYILAHNGLTFDFIFFKKMIYNYISAQM